MAAPGDVVIDRSAAPDAVRLALDRLGSTHPDFTDHLQEDPALLAAVVAVCAASRSLTRLLEADAGALDVLRALDHRPLVPEGADEESLRRWKAHEYLRIAARDLLAHDDLPTTAAALAALATDVLEGSCRLAGADELSVVGMGKLGGDELNYASDIDVMFVGVGESEARRVMRIARRCFRVDANLRPEGRDGPLVRSLASFEAYWERWAAPWEFQALLKARPVAGHQDLARTFAEGAQRHLWDRTFTADDLRALRTMKGRAEAEVARKGLTGRELKRGSGGIRDIEFAVQLLQLVHGRHDPALRSPNTLTALMELGTAGYVAADDAAELDRCYRLLRTVEHRLQLVDEQQVHTVPSSPSQREHLARTLGLRGDAEASALTRFDAELSACRSAVRAIHERLYFRPLLEAFADAPGPLSPEAAEARLGAFGFREPQRARDAVRDLTSGFSRASRLMHQLLPLLLGWLADSPDPDEGLLRLRTLASGTQRTSELTRAFRESPEVARRVCSVLGTSRLLGDLLHHNPDLIPSLASDSSLAPRSRADLLAAARTALDWRDDEARRSALKRSKERELLAIAVRDIVGNAGVDATASDLTVLAEATVAAAVEALEPDVPFGVVAMGRFGGSELSYASDLDVLFVYEGTTAAHFAEAERAATALLRFVKGATPTARIYLLDPDLRPEGKQGPLARSLDAYRTYFDRWAEVWERQAMVRARPVAGDPDVNDRFMDLLQQPVWGEALAPEDVREIRRIKARVEKERIPAGEDPRFHLKLGPGSLSDVEFCAQLLQLRHSVPATGTMQALARLGASGVLDPSDVDALAAAYRFCERTRNRLFLTEGSASDSLPLAPEPLGRLARSLDTTPGELRETYRRLTRRSRAVVERLFYGRA